MPIAYESYARIATTFSLRDIDPGDFGAIVTNRPNALLCGPPSTIDAALAAFEPYFPQPVARWSADHLRSLPRRARGTVILEHAEAYEQEQQRALLKWLDEARVQVVSTTDRPLVDLVERGLFLDHLYYRLNTVYLDLGCSTSLSDSETDTSVSEPDILHDATLPD